MTAKVSLKKSDGKVSLKKATARILKTIRLEFGWRASVKLDADVSAFVLDGNSKMLGPEYLVFFHQKISPDMAVMAGADVRDATGEKEKIFVNLDKVTDRAKEIAFILTIDEDKSQSKHFGVLTEADVTIYDDETNDVLVEFKFDASTFQNGESLVHAASLFRGENGWEIQGFAVGTPNQDLSGAVVKFGGDLNWYA